MTTIREIQSAIATQQRKVQACSENLRATQNDYEAVQAQIEAATASGDVKALETLQTRQAALRAVVPTFITAVKEAQSPLARLQENLGNLSSRHRQLQEQARDLERAIKSGAYEVAVQRAEQVLIAAKNTKSDAELRLEQMKVELLRISN